MEKIYISCPDIFRRQFGQKEFAEKVALCKKYGFVGLTPVEPSGMGVKVFKGNLDKIDVSQVVIADFNPFRGACVNDNTSAEVMAGYLKGKIVYGYSVFCNSSLTDIIHRVYGDVEHSDHPGIENFWNPVCLMLAGCVHESGGKILASFEDCLKDLKNKII
jgi:nucleoside 2-deoxyribosyltransferase